MPKYLRVTMPNGERWEVPVSIIAESRATYYADRDAGKEGLSKEERDKRYEEEYNNTLGDSFEVSDWASNNMNWVDVKQHAIQVESRKLTDREYQEGWVNGDAKIVDKTIV